jgi:GTP-binding protein EngB required for normal cell division
MEIPMNRSIANLQKDVQHIGDILGETVLFPLAGDTRQALITQADKVLEQLSAIEESFLTLGLLGGTGVGKSTLMNALAGRQIAKASHRRPHTDHILVYHYDDMTPSLGLEAVGAPWKTIVHEAEDIRHIVLCDLPDFDSIVGEHRRHVLSFLDRIDLVVWVTSPEKYADARFYDLLADVPKANENFCFVVNKIDLLFRDQASNGYQRLSRITGGFRQHLIAKGVSQPLLYPLSAQEVLDSPTLAPWNQFPAFKQFVFQQRSSKQMVAIKSANVDVQVRQLAASLRKEGRSLEDFRRVVEDAVSWLADETPHWLAAGRDALESWLASDVKSYLLSLHRDPSVLVGPGYAMAELVQAFREQLGKKTNLSRAGSSIQTADPILPFFEQRLEFTQDRLIRDILRHHLSSPYADCVRGVIDVPHLLDRLREDFATHVALHATNGRRPKRWGFKTLQWFTYILLFLSLVVTMVGEPALRELLSSPGLGTAFQLPLSMIHNLFSIKGLAALGSYLLVNLLVGYCFYRRYKQNVRRWAHRKLASLSRSLEKAWGKILGDVVDRLNHLKEEVDEVHASIVRLSSDSDST